MHSSISSRRMMLGLCVAATLLRATTLATPAAYPCRESSKFLTVETSSGLITGHLADDGAACVAEYLGVPYAKPPVGDLRFAPPQRYTGSEPYEAASFGNDCPQTPSGAVDYPDFTPQAQQIIQYFATAAGTPQSEDCLTLNIWSKGTGNSRRAKKPVLVFFHGGRFTIGNTNTPFYNGKHFAEAEDIVVVTVNYRLNIFGFPGAPGETQNPGLRDQRAAVEWLRDNVESFGGDPEKITIAGQSSGGVAVDYWAYAYTNDPIANGLIAHSGNAFSFPVNTPEVTENNWNTAVAAVNCTDAADTMACMREVGWEDLKAAITAIRPAASTSVLRSVPAFYPTPDGEIVFGDYVSLTEEGKFAKIPVLMGNNDNEAGYYRIPAYRRGIVPTDEQVASFHLESFTCPVSFQASERRRHGVHAWAYRYLGDWDNTRLHPTSGAYHGVDLHMIFGGSEEVSGLPMSDEQKQLSSLMQHAWFSFADKPEYGLRRLGWPEFDQDADTLVLFGKDNEPGPQLVNPSEYDAACSTITMGALGTGAATA